MAQVLAEPWSVRRGECPPTEPLRVLSRPCCYNCGEGGHTADECWRERPPLMRNEQQPALSQGTWGYGRASGDAARYGTNGYDGGAAVRYAVPPRCAVSICIESCRQKTLRA